MLHVAELLRSYVWCGPKFVEEQMQILRLTTPKLHPKEQRSLFGDPGTEERLGPLSLRMTASLMLRISDTGHSG
jgi:hypothetical protein